MATIQDPNKKIDVKREEVADRDSWAEPAMLLQQTAASMHPDGCKYKGSLAVHIYEVNGRMDMVLKSQIHVDSDVPSPQAWFAVKELIHAARKHYGHQEKESLQGEDFSDFQG
jgi:hypothetical protein